MNNEKRMGNAGKVTIRRAGLDDLDEAWAIVSEYYDAVAVEVREDRPSFLGSYFSDGSGIWLARNGEGAVAGCIALRPLAAFASAGEVKRLYVQPASRGQGIAGRLLGALENFAKAFGYGCLFLDSKDDLEAAIGFYESRGYMRCERYNDNPQATIFMRKCLTDVSRHEGRSVTGPIP
jgi:ribosomal protein S18 acetylase RimI-like enzyme